MDLETFNALPSRSAVAELTSCCSSPLWAQRLASSRPGRSGEELLRVLHERLGNDAITERCVLRDELAKINRIRLAQLVSA
jgi:2-oxo-4-hydroxy-4-carboxy--5-ureidoimidazoline (OHCU) decarboxylase